MEKIVRKYKLTENQQEIEDQEYWKNQSIEHKIEILESLREDAIKLGLFPNYNEDKQRLRRFFRIVKLRRNTPSNS